MSDNPAVDPVNNPPSSPPAEPEPQPAGTRAAKQPAKRAPAKKAAGANAGAEHLAQVRPVPEERSYADAITKEHRDFLKDEGVDPRGGSFAG